MYPWILITLVAAGFLLQHHLDARYLADVARQSRWIVSRITWAPLARFLSGSRWERCYWLRYVDESGSAVRRLCRVSGVLGLGSSVEFDSASAELNGAQRSSVHAGSQPRSKLGRLELALICVSAGAFIGAAVGIAGSLVIYPSSNIAPAYGLFLMTPIGTLAGLLFALTRSR